MTRQTHLRETIITHPMTVITDASNIKIRAICKQYPIKLCALLTEKLLMTAFKSKIIRFKMDKDTLQRRIYFLTFVESPQIIYSQYTETREVTLDYPNIGGYNIEDDAKKATRDILHSNIDVHSRRLIAKFPIYGEKKM